MSIYFYYYYFLSFECCYATFRACYVLYGLSIIHNAISTLCYAFLDIPFLRWCGGFQNIKICSPKQKTILLFLPSYIIPDVVSVIFKKLKGSKMSWRHYSMQDGLYGGEPFMCCRQRVQCEGVKSLV